jgi:RNA polymerase sigma-70 factor (ECF subfamily)
LSEVDVIQRLQTGDRAAFSLLYRTHAQTAIRTAFLITRNKPAAEDAVQEAFVQVIRTIARLRNAAAFRPWFYRIVINTAKRLSRNTNRSRPFDLDRHDQIDLTALSPDEAAIGSEEIDAVRQAIAGLNAAHREVIILRYYTDLSEEEIAVALGVPVGTTKSRLHRARAALHDHLESRGPTEYTGQEG